MTLVDDSGRHILTTRADDGGCCECKNLITLSLHGETLTLPFDLDLVGKHGKPLPVGHYSVTATLNSLDAPAARPSATAHLQVDAAR